MLNNYKTSLSAEQEAEVLKSTESAKKLNRKVVTLDNGRSWIVPTEKELKSARTVNETIVEMLKLLGEEIASDKTLRYFIKKDTFLGYVYDVAQTLEGLRSTKGTTVLVDDDFYAVSEYKVPTKLEDYLKTGRIYASNEAIDELEPFSEMDKVNCTLTPAEFNKFFDNFNAAQEQDKRIATTSFKAQSCSLENIQYLEDKNGLGLRRFHETGFDEMTCQLVALKIDAISDYLRLSPKYTVRKMVLWLLK